MKALAEELGKLLLQKGLTLSTAESCTGGGIASIITAIPGSSQYFHGGIVAYANEVKMALLEVQSETLEKHGAVSEQTVVEMAKGAMKSMKTTCSIATSGIAGPGGGTAEKPVGTIWIAVACNKRIVTKRLEGDFGRAENIKNTIKNALSLLIKTLK
ncbi:MAG: CinA family protein [Bacteroides sp.]|nr:CinA family protein [Bacteroides sp.]